MLVAVQPVPDRLQLVLGAVLLALQVRDRRVGTDEVGGQPAAGVLEPGDLGVLGQGAATVRQLGEGGVDALQVEQTLLVSLVGSDGVLPPCARPPGPAGRPAYVRASRDDGPTGRTVPLPRNE